MVMLKIMTDGGDNDNNGGGGGYGDSGSASGDTGVDMAAGAALSFLRWPTLLQPSPSLYTHSTTVILHLQNTTIGSFPSQF